MVASNSSSLLWRRPRGGGSAELSELIDDSSRAAWCRPIVRDTRQRLTPSSRAIDRSDCPPRQR
jgi:hypothetical protein